MTRRRLAQVVASIFLVLNTSAQPADSALRQLRVNANLERIGDDGRAVLVTSVNVIDRHNAEATDYQGPVHLSVTYFEPGGPILAEFAPTGYVELVNTSATPIDLGNWELFLQRSGPNQEPHVLVFPQPTFLEPGQIASYSTGENLTENPPHFTYPWEESFNLSRLDNVRLFDPHGELRDEVLTPSLPRVDVYRWSGRPLSSSTSYRRIGSANHFRRTDWTGHDSPTFRTADNEINLPWDTWQPLEVPPHEFEITAGKWSGTIPPPQTDEPVIRILAQTPDGLIGQSEPIDLSGIPKFALHIIAGDSALNEISPATEATVEVTLDTATTEALAVTIENSNANELQTPAEVIIPAGSRSAQFTATALDDTEPDGDAAITVSATAPGLRASSIQFTILDNEVSQMQLLLPDTLEEEAGWVPNGGTLILPAPAAHDVAVRLQSEPPIQVPNEVVIPSGQQQADFNLRANDDRLVAPEGRTTTVTATTGSWKPAVAQIAITDTEWDAQIKVEVPEWIQPGQTKTGLIRPATASLVDRFFTTRIAGTSDPERIILPSIVRLPAGEATVSFPIKAANGSTDQLSREIELSIWDPAFRVNAKERFELLETPREPTQIELRTQGLFRFSGDSFPAHATLKGYDSRIVPVDTQGQFEVNGAENQVDVLPQPGSIELVEGEWSGEFQLNGEALGLRPTIRVGDLEAEGLPIDLLQGRTFDFTPYAVVWNSRSETILAGGDSMIVEIDPYSLQEVRRLETDFLVNQILLTGDPKSVWIRSSNKGLLRLDLESWTLSDLFPLDPGTPFVALTQLIAVPGSDNVLFAILEQHGSPYGMGFYQDGILKEPLMPPPASKPSRIAIHPEGTDLILVTPDSIQRYRVNSDQFTISIEQVTEPQDKGSSLNMELFEDKLYIGNGAIYDATTLELQSPGDQFRIPGFAVPEHSLRLILGDNVLGARGFEQHFPRSSHRIPSYGGSLIRWGARGLAYKSRNEGQLVILETPILEPQQPDLKLALVNPTQTLSLDEASTWIWPIEVSNVGTTTAHQVELITERDAIPIGSLSPGTARVIEVSRQNGRPGIHKEFFQVQSIQQDLQPNDNQITASVRIQGRSVLNQRELIQGTTDLETSPTGHHIYAAQNQTAGGLNDGVAIIAPETGAIVASLATGPDPRRLAVTPDGEQLFVQIGDFGLEIWDLANRERLADWSVECAIVDLIAIPAAPGGPNLIIACEQELVAFSNEALHSQTIFEAADLRSIRAVGNTIYGLGATALHRIQMTSDGFGPHTQFPTSRISGSNIQYDGTYLIFENAAFDVAQGEFTNFRFSGNPFVVDPQSKRLLVMQGSGMVAYRLPDPTRLPIQQQLLPSDFQEVIRWGSNGLAGRTRSQQILIWNHPALEPPVQGDIAVEVIPPNEEIFARHGIWTIRVHNRTTTPVSQAQLRLHLDGISRESELTTNRPFVRSNSVWIVDIGPLESLESKELTLTQLYSTQQTSLTAEVQANVPPSTQGDDSVTTRFRARFPDASLTLNNLPPILEVDPNSEFEVAFDVTNHGPSRVSPFRVDVSAPAFQILAPPETRELARGEATATSARFKAPSAPGLYRIDIDIRGSTDTNRRDNVGTLLVSVPGLDTAQPLTHVKIPDRATFVQNPNNGELLATFSQFVPYLYKLDASFRPLSAVQLPAEIVDFKLTDDRKYAWTVDRAGFATRVNLETMSIESTAVVNTGSQIIGAILPSPLNPNRMIATVGQRVALFDLMDVQLVESLPEQGTASIYVSRSDTKLSFRIFDTTGQHIRDSTSADLPSNKESEHADLIALLQSLELQEELGLFTQWEVSTRVRTLLDTPFEAPNQYTQNKSNFSFSSSDLIFADNGDVFAVAGPDSDIVRLSFTNDGLTLVTTIESPGRGASHDPLGWRGNYLTLAAGGIFNTETHERVSSLPENFQLLSSQLEGEFIVGKQSTSEGSRLLLLDATNDFSPIWQVPLEVDRLSPSTFAVAPQTLLVFSSFGSGDPLLVHFAPIFDSQAGFESRWEGPTEAIRVESTVAGKLILNPTGFPIAQNARVRLELSPHLAFSNPPNGETVTRSQSLALGTFLDPAVIDLELTALQSGEARLSAQIISDGWTSERQSTVLQIAKEPRFIVRDYTILESDRDTDRPGVQVGFDGPVTQDTVLLYEITPISADEEDFNGLTGRLHFRTGTRTTRWNPTRPDTWPEAIETAQVQFQIEGSLVPFQECTLRILDDDLHQVTIKDFSFVEGSDGNTWVDLEVRVTPPTVVPFNVPIRWTSGTATPGTDFFPGPPFAAFSPPQSAFRFSFPIIGDTDLENDETIQLNLLGANHVELIDPVGTITIQDDDFAPTITSITVGDETILIEAASAQDIQLSLEATSGLDETPWELVPGTWTAENETTQITIPRSEISKLFFRIRSDQQNSRSRETTR